MKLQEEWHDFDFVDFGGSTSSGGSLPNAANPAEFSVPAQPAPHANTANQNPRMGYAIGYLRKSSNASQVGIGDSDAKPNPMLGASSNSAFPQRQHEYQTISDDEFGGPLDLGPSLMDEVFSELDSSKDSTEHAKNLDEDVDETDRMDDKREHKSRLHSMKEMKDLVSNKIHLNKLIIQSYLSGHKFEETRTVT